MIQIIINQDRSKTHIYIFPPFRSLKQEKMQSNADPANSTSPLLPTNKRKNEEFHTIFEGDESELVEDFSCALQKDILVHGRLYISHNAVGFYSNILGWTTSIMVKFSDIVKVEKRNSAFVLPNALMLYTNQHKKYFFASFVFRDLAYNILISMWRSAVSGILVGNDMSYLEDQSDFSLGLSSENSALIESDDTEDEDTLTVDNSTRHRAHSENDLNVHTRKVSESASNPDLSTQKPNQYTDNLIKIPNGDSKEPCDSDNIVFETTYSPFTVAACWDLIYSDESYSDGGFSHLFHTQTKGITEWNTGKWKPANETEKQSRHVEYIMPLTNPLGPKQVKTYVDEVVDEKDLRSHIHLTQTTATP
eukprot:NODE_4_length_77007_cov_1.156642.p22 type:complete len:363 gc:universal NODE_4_length_77007_cov_1.156642:5607-4519(-)